MVRGQRRCLWRSCRHNASRARCFPFIDIPVPLIVLDWRTFNQLMNQFVAAHKSYKPVHVHLERCAGYWEEASIRSIPYARRQAHPRLLRNRALQLFPCGQEPHPKVQMLYRQVTSRACPGRWPPLTSHESGKPRMFRERRAQNPRAMPALLVVVLVRVKYPSRYTAVRVCCGQPGRRPHHRWLVLSSR